MKQVVIGFVMVTLLSGCGNKNEANTHNFGAALNHYLRRKVGYVSVPVNGQWKSATGTS